MLYQPMQQYIIALTATYVVVAREMYCIAMAISTTITTKDIL